MAILSEFYLGFAREGYTPFSCFKCLRGQINMSRATFDRELRVARARFTAFFILSRGLSVQNTAIRSLAFQQEKLTVPYLAVI
jgi:hypothetical protein